MNLQMAAWHNDRIKLEERNKRAEEYSAYVREVRQEQRIKTTTNAIVFVGMALLGLGVIL